MRAQQNELRRSRSNRVIGGVCGGLAEFFGIERVLVPPILPDLPDPWRRPGSTSLCDHVDHHPESINSFQGSAKPAFMPDGTNPGAKYLMI